MLRVNRLPGSLMELLEGFRPCFTAPTFTTFALLAAGLIARPAGRTVCGMLAGAGLGGVWHHSRAHRFFAAAAWSADAAGLVVLRLAADWLLPAGALVVVAAGDTMFRRAGRKVHAAHWAYDGSLKVPKGGKKVSRGNTFVIAAVIAGLPFLRRPVALPVAARLWRKGGPARTALARELTGLIAAASRGRSWQEVAGHGITRSGKHPAAQCPASTRLAVTAAARRRGHPRREVNRAADLDHGPHRAALGIRRAAVAASRSPGRRRSAVPAPDHRAWLHPALAI